MLIYAIGSILVLFIILIAWGLVRIRNGNAQAVAAIRNVRLQDFPDLIIEGKEGLRRGYGIEIDLQNHEEAAKILDELFIDQAKLKNTFSKDDFYWYFVLPVGALIGEFIHIHAKGIWKESPEGPFMDIPVPGGVATCHPFDKALKQNNQGQGGDLYAYLLSSKQFSIHKEIVDGLWSDGSANNGDWANPGPATKPQSFTQLPSAFLSLQKAKHPPAS